MYQLIMLPQTELNTPSSRRKFGIKSKHRIMPRSFGRYHLAGSSFIAVESEEILFENLTLPFEDYIRCRELDLTVEVLHNGKIYEELQAFCELSGLNWFDFILRFYENRRNYDPAITEMYDDFKRGLTDRLWETRDDLELAVKENIDPMLRDERGTNEMSMGKATGFLVLFNKINTILFSEMKIWLQELGLNTPDTNLYLNEISRFSRMRKIDLMNSAMEHIEYFNFDIALLSNLHFSTPLADAKLAAPKKFKISHNEEQRAQISTYLNEFGKSHDGMGKMLMRYPHVHRLFRHPENI